MKHWNVPGNVFYDSVQDDGSLLDHSVTSPSDQPQHTHFSELGEREQLLRCFSRAYESLLRNPLRDAACLESGFVEKGDEVFDVSHHLVYVIGEEQYLVPAGSSILQAFDDAEQALLILGEPGVGKSTLLLELAMQLIMRAEKEEQYPLPVIVPLSSWAVKRLPLQYWLSEQVSQTPRLGLMAYNVTR